MRFLLFFLVYSFISLNTLSQDSSSSISVTGKILIANAGFAPIPAFSFDSPLAIASLSVKKKRFSYEPDFSLGFNGRPWMGNNWFRYTFFQKKKLRTNAGINPSFFYKTDQLATGEKISNALRNLTFELVSEYKSTKHLSLTFTYMHIHAFDKGALSGDFFDCSSTVSGIGISKNISVTIQPELFYFDFEGKVDGFFTSTRISVEHKKIPLSLHFQWVFPLWVDFPAGGFKWNTGLTYIF